MNTTIIRVFIADVASQCITIFIAYQA